MADATAETDLTILVCSANVGNAEPTPESFAQWIPADGSIADPLSSTKYPVRDGLHEGAEAVAASFADATEEDKKFDIIVLGMQEAAFVDKSARYYDKSTHHLADGEATAGGGGGGGGADDVDGGGGGGGGDGTPKKKGNNVKQILRRNIKATMAAQAFMGVNKKEETTQPDSSSDRPSLTDAVNKGVDAVHRGEKKVKKRKNTIFRKADKTNLVLRGLTTSEEYKSPKSRHSHGDGKDHIPEGSAFRSGSYDTRKFKKLIDDQCPSYSMVAAKLQGEMRLIILALKDVAEQIEDVYIATENTGIGSVLANKGGIITTLTLRGTRLSFMTAHLEAHEGATHLQNRNKNLAEIFAGAKTDPTYLMQDATVISHHMFVCGDLNYRINFGDGEDSTKDKKKNAREKLKRGLSKAALSTKKLTSSSLSDNKKLDGSDGNGVAGGTPASPAAKEERGKDNGSHFAQAKELVDAEDWKALNEGDELAKALEKKDCLVGFKTLPCNWPPTFKVARGEGYQYNEKRTPSYTDRILWKSAHGMGDDVVPFLYEPCPDFITSDHKPIRGGYVVKMKNATKCKEKPPKSKKGMRESNISKTHERQVNLLISNIKCTNLPIMDSELLGGLSDPYILFVSYPKPLLWRKGWPSTKIITRNLNPVWEEDIHLTLDHTRCTDADGSLTLHGSMLYMTVMDEDITSGDDVIGTVALNLNSLCSELDISPSSPSSSNVKFNDHVQETVISTPVLRDGLEYGMMECTIQSAYLTQKETKGFLKEAKRGKKVRAKTRKKTLTNKISEFLRL